MDTVQQTEEEFLAAYDASAWPHPSLTADIALFRETEQGLELLLVQRGNHPYKGFWALPGGFAEPEETIEQTAVRELYEETGIADVVLEPVALYSTPGRDPRDWVVTQSFVGLLDTEAVPGAGDDAAKAQWFGLSCIKEDRFFRLTLACGNEVLNCRFAAVAQPITARLCAQITDANGFAFDHYRIISDAYLALLRR